MKKNLRNRDGVGADGHVGGGVDSLLSLVLVQTTRVFVQCHDIYLECPSVAHSVLGTLVADLCQCMLQDGSPNPSASPSPSVSSARVTGCFLPL